MEAHEFGIELLLFAPNGAETREQPPQMLFCVTMEEEKRQNLFSIFCRRFSIRFTVFAYQKKSVNRFEYKYMEFMLLHVNNWVSNEFQMNKFESFACVSRWRRRSKPHCEGKSISWRFSYSSLLTDSSASTN